MTADFLVLFFFWFCVLHDMQNTRDLKKIRTRVVRTLNGRLVVSKCEGRRLEDASDHSGQNDKSLPWPILAASLTAWATAATCRFASCDTAWPALLPRGVDKSWREIKKSDDCKLFCMHAERRTKMKQNQKMNARTYYNTLLKVNQPVLPHSNGHSG